MKIGFSQPKVLDFDIEVRPLGWYGGDFVHKEVTAIASAWVVDGEPFNLQVYLLQRHDKSPKRILTLFRARYDAADMVTGHYVRGFDLPILNGAMYEYDLGALDPKLSHDTKLDEIKTQGLSHSQENKASMLEIVAPKVQMTMASWRMANRLLKDGLELVRERVAGDVIQNIYMREEQMRRGFLGKPSVWDPGSTSFTASYVP